MVQVIKRVGDILGGFSEEHPVRTLGECAESAGITKSSAHRLLTSLEEIGLVEKDEAACWQLGSAVLRLAAIRMSHRHVREEVVQGLRRLGQEFEAATAFSVPNGSDIVYVERTDSPRPYAPAAHLGSVLPMWHGASGRAMLAVMTAEEREAHLDTPAWHELDRAFRERVLGAIDEAGRLGYAIDDGTWIESIAGVAVSVDAVGGPVAAASLIVSPDRMDPELAERMGAALRALVSDAVSAATIVGRA